MAAIGDHQRAHWRLFVLVTNFLPAMDAGMTLSSSRIVSLSSNGLRRGRTWAIATQKPVGRSEQFQQEDEVKKFVFYLLLGLLAVTGSPSIMLGQQTGYKQTNLVANLPGVANHTDSQLSNPWGISVLPNQPF